MLAALGTADSALPAQIRPWLFAAGFPVILVKLDAVTGVLTLTQQV